MAVPPQKSPPLELYRVETYTTDKKKLKLKKLKAFAVLHGALGNTERFPLIQCSDHKNKKIFRKGGVDTFYSVCNDVKDLSSITIITETNPGWFLDSVIVKVCGRTYSGNFQRWMGATERAALTVVDTTRAFNGGRLLLGPMLKLRSNICNVWNVSATVVTDNARDLREPLQFWTSTDPAPRTSAPPVCFFSHHNYQMWRFDFSVPLTNLEAACQYTVPGLPDVFQFMIPAIMQKPGILFCSCNDRAHPYNLSIGEFAHKNDGWEYMEMETKKANYHLLIWGGDQVYADPVFVGCPTTREWEFLPKDEKWPDSLRFFTDRTIEEVNMFYFNLYVMCWSHAGTQKVMASVPSVMMYDDHDIFDGWGSLDPYMNDSAMLINIFKVARKYFFLFQMQGDLSSVLNERIVPDDETLKQKIKTTPPFPSYGIPETLMDEGPFTIALDLTGGVSVLLLDARTERRMFDSNNGLIMSENSYQNVERWLLRKAQQNQVQHLFCVCTCPIHYPDSSLFNKISDLTHNGIIDDVRDHYSAVIHKKEQGRVLADLADFIALSLPGTRATILAGDVHVGAFSSAMVSSKLRPDRGFLSIEQYISSGIAALPPPKFAQQMLKTPLFRAKDQIHEEGMHAIMSMQKLPSNKLFFATQNFLCLNPTPTTYLARWVGNPKLTDEQSLTKTITTPLTEPVTLERVVN